MGDKSSNCIPGAPCTTYKQLGQPESLLSPAILTTNITLKRDLVNLFSFRDFLRPMSFVYFLILKTPPPQDGMLQLRGNDFMAMHFTQIKSPFLSTLFSIVLNYEVPPYFSEQRTNTRNDYRNGVEGQPDPQSLSKGDMSGCNGTASITRRSLGTFQSSWLSLVILRDTLHYCHNRECLLYLCLLDFRGTVSNFVPTFCLCTFPFQNKS